VYHQVITPSWIDADIPNAAFLLRNSGFRNTINVAFNQKPLKNTQDSFIVLIHSQTGTICLSLLYSKALSPQQSLVNNLLTNIG
jgi:hypothetical protein